MMREIIDDIEGSLKDQEKETEDTEKELRDVEQSIQWIELAIARLERSDQELASSLNQGLDQKEWEKENINNSALHQLTELQTIWGQITELKEKNSEHFGVIDSLSQIVDMSEAKQILQQREQQLFELQNSCRVLSQRLEVLVRR